MTSTWIQEVMKNFGSKQEDLELFSDEHIRIGSAEFYFVTAGEVAPSEFDGKIVHEDIFRARPSQLIARITALAGFNVKRIHGRQTEVRKINRPQAEDFNALYHLNGPGGGKDFYGLFYANELTAVAAFSRPLEMKYESPPYMSGELVRYCSKSGVHVPGGLDKLIQHYFRQHPVDDIVTYIDMEWSDGRSFYSIGFSNVGVTSPICFLVDRLTWCRVRDVTQSIINGQRYYHLLNKGNLKLRLLKSTSKSAI